MEVDKKIYYPIFASRSLNGGIQSEEEFRDVNARMAQLSSESRLRLMSTNMAEALAVLDEQFHIPGQFVEYVTVLVRDMFFGNFSEQEVLRALRGELSKIQNIPLDAVIQHIQLNVFKAQPDAEEGEDEEAEASSLPESVKQYTLLDALGKFSNLGNQLITTENIKLKSQAALVRPTLTNWLKNYRDELGIGKHDAVTRAKFLFESKNTARLPSQERNRIHVLVRSLEDNEVVNIDTQKQEVVFTPEMKKENASPRNNRPQDIRADSPDIFERFQQPVAREELQNVGSQTFLATTPLAVEKKTNEEAAVLTRIKNMLVSPPKANAPAPTEEFIEPVRANEIVTTQPLGTLRFSANHVLPAERQQLVQSSPIPPVDPRIQHFRPQAVAIPDEQDAYTYSPTSTGPQHMVHMASPQSIAVQNNQSAPSSSLGERIASTERVHPELPVSQAARPSVFRIKPNRD